MSSTVVSYRQSTSQGAQAKRQRVPLTDILKLAASEIIPLDYRLTISVSTPCSAASSPSSLILGMENSEDGQYIVIPPDSPFYDPPSVLSPPFESESIPCAVFTSSVLAEEDPMLSPSPAELFHQRLPGSDIEDDPREGCRGCEGCSKTSECS